MRKIYIVTVTVRVPQSRVSEVQDYLTRPAVPLYQSKVAAGFPSPADDYCEGSLSLDEYLIRNPAATFFVRANGESMTGAGIFPDDLLIVDRSLTPRHGDVVIAAICGELTVKRLHHSGGSIRLMPENPTFREIVIDEENGLDIWGVVKYVVHAL